ncbi:hypothetical protein C3O22_22230 [Salmonella enterica subsp. enterica]|nr:hypothetical protein [Salmonella enterica]EBW5061614.1 hypothetical protein [Salmonella enterica subsp. enterica serovar Somone]ECE0404266.1 hypothetical protein [Salmonella enterica subsp. enterica]MIP82388.1 hypothetical protein [Salmonella enterica subsp. enterica serovar Uzaramo]
MLTEIELELTVPIYNMIKMAFITTLSMIQILEQAPITRLELQQTILMRGILSVKLMRMVIK